MGKFKPPKTFIIQPRIRGVHYEQRRAAAGGGAIASATSPDRGGLGDDGTRDAEHGLATEIAVVSDEGQVRSFVGDDTVFTVLRVRIVSMQCVVLL